MSTVLLANEIGIGRGHIVNLANFVVHMGKDHSYFAGLHNDSHAAELQSLGVSTFRGKGLHFLQKQVANAAGQHPEGYATWADYLFAIGLAREEILRANLSFWIDTLLKLNAQYLVAEYAPTALLAGYVMQAQNMPLKRMAIGTAYSVPPANIDSFPVFLPDFSYSAREEADVLALINGVLHDYNSPPLPSIAAIYDVDLPLPLGFSQFDPYRKWRDQDSLVLPFTTAPADLQHGDEVFLYLSADIKEPDLITAICDLPLPRRAYLPSVNRETIAQMRAAGVIIENAPVPFDLLAKRSRMIVHYAQANTIQMAAFHGLPQVGFPLHLENTFHGRRAAQKGVMELLEPHQRSRDNVTNLIQRSYHSAAMQARARDFAGELAVEAADTSRSMAARLARFLNKGGPVRNP